MKNLFYEGKVLWSHIDANMHLRHSAYADFAAQARLNMLDSIGITADTLKQYKVGPILFREELIYLREVNPNDVVKVSCEMTKGRMDGSRWSFTQELYRGDAVKAAIIHVDGAWIDMVHRKLASLPQLFLDKFMHVPKSENFVLEEIKNNK